jgi:hypothetical protein
MRLTVAMVKACGRGKEKKKEEGVCREERETGGGC